MVKERILVVDDEQEICELLKDYLENEGYEVFVAYDGKQGYERFQQEKPILAILDIMLPLMEGTELCRKIRNESSIPIIMLSAKKSDIDKILSLGLGADDYMTKPFSPSELVARVKAHLRRFLQMNVSNEGQAVFTYENLQIDSKAHKVIVDGQSMELSAKEFALLHFLANHQGQVFTRDQIFDHVWGFNEYGDVNTVTVHIRRIREKIEVDPTKPKFIKTIWGVGYKFGE
ncbi:response regulator transcription factor [Desulfuribacillus stibiiarsenatis]|uniref:response regulator transcription factor n=1 Tax=Desulfuribacillus stibiiarsenatis TaxID=1390249 RepID=UPI0009F5A4A9|nr:response regulator transcription factor [Desulfuribacillus stibiiarsenatis]